MVGCAALALAALLVAGCGKSDPRLEALAERQRFTVELVSWLPQSDDTLSVTVRLTGPPNSAIERLSFRISQFDGAGGTLASEWRTIDTAADLPMGATREMIFRVASAGEAVDGMAVSLVPVPTPADEPHIVELEGL